MNNLLSKKLVGADNQQERLEIESWIVGFTDGEGCFSASFIKNKTTKSGWQLFPEFVITQGAKSISALEAVQNYFQCGKIFVNKRYDNHNEYLYRYCVRSIKDLRDKIIPFFEKRKLKTYKARDFRIFARIVKCMSRMIHLKPKGMKRIAEMIEHMNRKKKSRFLKSSETKR
ncbi:MAG: hypothetical protein A3C08_02325 [Candidatus Taylorbacteria bacterium RIFCSPHIGHO2_02_FULL_47_18]|nr:MAG: hypothetical protein A3C08_02325 [Candidatus Taylorbacteria bacterium RIFCSPHIGHO2_02_FULL_47_18]OHA40978.1 MAG: hypothetical protein A3J31_02400 [Candidatus Taylorbacteria bacterium RIFCSPLOWO2_02_FULL_48_16]OHA45342.1 MAG: hypothetical protein A3H13_00815 [Candidatus Taylorbacteria bacterium RIFCSPLOWO2_12_FULL_48_11]